MRRAAGQPGVGTNQRRASVVPVARPRHTAGVTETVRIRWSSSVLVAVLGSLVACKGDKPPKRLPSTPAPGSAEVQRSLDVAAARGRELIGTFKKNLVARLQQALPQGAPAAIAVCQQEAPQIAAALATHGAKLGRVTRKPRNPANAASGWQAEALAEFEGLVAAGKPLDGAGFTRLLPAGVTAYAEPIVIQPLCLTCHGEQLAPEVTAALAERYPTDQATGYKLGELRGAAWVELPSR